MKTKNILKIGIFSIVLFTLLISPVLKNNILEVRAISECEKDENNGECINKGLNCSTLGDYVESSFKCTNDRDDKCCIPNPTPGTVTVPQRGTQIIKTTLKEERADDICKIGLDDTREKCGVDNPGFFAEQECKMQAFFTYQWCQIVKGIVEGLGKMFAGLINLEIEWILNALNPKAYGGFATNVGVIAIWTMLRNIVNSLLVLGLIGIAIATILGYKKYAWKQILWKLILVALLVNFSLVISGIIVDTSNYLTGYFLSMSQENGSTAPRIMESFGYTESTTPDTYDPPSIFGDDKYKTPAIVGAEEPDEVESYTLRFGNFFIISFVMILVGGFAVIALLSIFLTVIIRNLLLIILLGLSPIAFAAWIFPGTEKYWKMWWDNFLKWCSFPIIFAFALYLGLTAMAAINSMAPIGTTDSMAVTIIRMVLFSMFLVGGLIFSLQSGGAVSQTIIKQTSKIGSAVGAKVGTTVTRGVQGSNTYRAAAKKLTQVPLLNKLGHNMLDQSDRVQKAADIRKYEKDMENRSKGEIVDIANGKAPIQMNKDAYAHYVAARNIALKKGWVKNDDQAIDSIRRDVRNNNPDLDAKIIRDAKPQYFKIGKEGKLEELDQKAPDYKEQVVNNLKGMSPENLPKKTEYIIEAIKEAGGDIDEFLQELVYLKTNQLRALLDNVSEEESNQGTLFGGTSTNPKPYAGPNGAIATSLKDTESRAINKHAKVDAKLKANPNDATLKAKERAAYNEWVKADKAINELNQKLKTSNSLKETLGTPNI